MTPPQDAPAGPVLGEDVIKRAALALNRVQHPRNSMKTDASPVGQIITAAVNRRAVAAVIAALDLPALLSSAREEGAAAERERIEKERERHARAALGLPPRPLDGPS